MTDQQINEAIALACGWIYYDGWNHPDGKTELPNYCADLNAMHEAEEKGPSQLSDEYDKWLDMLTRKTLLIDELQVQLAAVTKERDEAIAEVARLKAGGCARDQRTTQFCAEAVALQERIKRLEEALAVVVPKCDWLHHEKKHQHCASEPCPVVEMILKAKEAR